jgi:hypothetical protein
MPRGCAVAILAALSLFGALLILLALGFIIVNEGQVDLARIARDSRAVHPGDPSAQPGALVSLTGVLEAEGGPIGDGRFLTPGAYLRVERVVEMYAWEEYKAYEDSNGRPVYRDRKIWARSLSGLGHVSNPSKALDDLTASVEAARIGAVAIDPRAADLPSSERLALREDMLLPGVKGAIENDQLYVGAGTPRRPEIGDLRITYYVVPSGRLVTVFAALEGERMVAYQAADGRAIYKVIEGDREAALRELGAVELIGAWLVRVCATAAIWFGLLLFFYSSRRLVAWPKALGITAGSARLASAVGLPLAVIAIVSLWQSGGSLLALAAALGAGALAAAAAVAWRALRARPAPGSAISS